MKKYIPYLYLGLIWLLTACPGPEPISQYKPIIMTRAQLETSVIKKEPLPISKPGKLYQYGHIILINELYKGVHLIDNANPRSPKNIAFVQVPGCVDFAIKNNIMYVDNAVDLVAVDLQDLNNIRVVKRVRDAFPELLPPDNALSRYDLAGAPQDAVIIGWEPLQ